MSSIRALLSTGRSFVQETLFVYSLSSQHILHGRKILDTGMSLEFLFERATAPGQDLRLWKWKLRVWEWMGRIRPRIPADFSLSLRIRP